MKKVIAAILALSVIISASAVNLIGNGTLAGEGDFPYGWQNKSRALLNFQRNGGPGGAGMLNFSSPDTPGKIEVRQFPFTLVPGEMYRVSFLVKTSAFHAKHIFVGIHNAGWHSEDGIKKIPANTDGWEKLSAEFKLSKTTNPKKYGFAVFLTEMTGSISFADFQITPLTEKAEKDSRGQNFKGGNIAAFITPVIPRLASLPAGTESIPFAWVQKNNADAVLRCSIDDKYTVNLTVKDKKFLLFLPEWARKDSHLLRTVLIAKNGKELGKAEFRFGFAKPFPKTKLKHFNNLMCEVLNVPGTKKSYDFVNPRDGWVYFRTEGIPRTTLILNGEKNPLIIPYFHYSEAQRFLKAGKYTLTLDQPISGNVIVRLIPVIYQYRNRPCPVGFEQAGNFNMFYQKKTVFSVCNVIGNGLYADCFPEARKRGLEWCSRFKPYAQSPFSSGLQKKMTNEMNTSDSFRNSGSSWVEFDEYFWNNPFSMLMCARSYERLRNPYGKKLFNWISGPVDFTPEQIHYDIVSRMFNACGGRGYLVYELYFRPKATEKEAIEHIRDQYDKSLIATDKICPGSRPYTGLILGNFTLMPILSLDHRTDVDYRYYLDLQFNIMANDPKYAGVGMVGYWGCHYADQEMNDWSYALLRHYVLEGHREMLSSKYGMTYKLSHIKDGDFQDGLKMWQVTGNVKPGKLFGYAESVQKRWGGPQTGDTFALFTGCKGKKNQVSQTITGLVPGKPYKLYFAVGDYKDCKAKKSNPRKLLLDCTVEGAKITKHLHYVSRYEEKKQKSTVNMHQVFFVPSKTEHRIVFSDSGKYDGEQLMLNFVKVTSHYIP